MGTAVLAAALASGVLGAGVPAVARDVRVHHDFFGVHDSTPGTASLSTIHEGSVRLWDAGVRWDQVQTGPHTYDWSTLDALVSEARAAHAEVLMVVAMTPS